VWSASNILMLPVVRVGRDAAESISEGVPGQIPSVLGSWKVLVWSGDVELARAIYVKLIPRGPA
jgi:hypothetical protein